MYLSSFLFIIVRISSAESICDIQSWFQHIQSSSVFSLHNLPSNNLEGPPCYDVKDILSVKIEVEEEKMTATFKNGSHIHIYTTELKLEKAIGSATLVNGDFEMSGLFNKGCFVGLIRYYKLYNTDFSSELSITERAIIGVTYFENRGIPYNGISWRIIRGIYEPNLLGYMAINSTLKIPTSESEFKNMYSGKNILFLYPDYNTAQKGHFKNGDMVWTQMVTVIEFKLNYAGIIIPITTKEFGSIFKRDISNNKTFSLQPLLKDPYEGRNLEVRQSNIQNAGEGVFAKRSIEANTLVGFFNGYRVKEGQIASSSVFDIFFFDSKKHKYLVQIGDKDDYLDINGKFAQIKHYNATSGHKINHSRNSNVEYFDCDHPRYGHILCTYSKKDISKDEELTVTYALTIDKKIIEDVFRIGLVAGQLYTKRSKSKIKKSIQPFVKIFKHLNKQHDVTEFLEYLLGFS